MLVQVAQTLLLRNKGTQVDPTLYQKSWFLSTTYGSAWSDSTLTDVQYENALTIAILDHRMIHVFNNCPHLAATALPLYIAIILTQGGSGEGATVIDPSATDKVAYVTADKVYDIQRNYTLVDAPKEISGSLPSNLLTRIFEQCKPIVSAMRVVRGAVGCGKCGTSTGVVVGDMSDG